MQLGILKIILTVIVVIVIFLPVVYATTQVGLSVPGENEMKPEACNKQKFKASTLYVSFPEPPADQATPMVEFTNGLISTGNTYGILGASDGWDWPGEYNYDSMATDYNGVPNGWLEFDWKLGPWWSLHNECAGFDCSGGYGIDVTITKEMAKIIKKGGKAMLSFDYAWGKQDHYILPHPFETEDEVWIKARWVSPFTGNHDLGEELSSEGADTTPEINFQDNPNYSLTGHYTKDISKWIEKPGTYYLELGGKLLANSNNEAGAISFDNLQIKVFHPSTCRILEDIKIQ